jgi:hypothetical protein
MKVLVKGLLTLYVVAAGLFAGYIYFTERRISEALAAFLFYPTAFTTPDELFPAGAALLAGVICGVSLIKDADDRQRIACDSCGRQYTWARWRAANGCLSCGSDIGHRV